MKALRKLLSCNKGATAIEYAIIAGMIGLTIITAATNVGTEVSSVFGEVQTGMQKRGG